MLDAIWSTKLIANYTYLILVIIFGSGANVANQYKKAREKGMPFGLIDVFIAFIIASFAGTVFGLVASVLGYTGVKVNLISGVGAFMGIGGLNKLTDMLIGVLVSKVKTDGKPD
jgi:hypothetical protein